MRVFLLIFLWSKLVDIVYREQITDVVYKETTKFDLLHAQRQAKHLDCCLPMETQFAVVMFIILFCTCEQHSNIIDVTRAFLID